MEQAPVATFDLDGDAEAIDDFFLGRGWSDGLPIVPPTRARVEAMLDAIDIDPDAVIGEIPVSRRIADARSIAVNAVMAGCRPQHLRAVVAILEAALKPDFNLVGIQATTHVAAPLAIFGGPIVKELGFNNDAGLLGPGNRTNAVVGRAVRLVLLNIGGGTIGVGDKSTFGQPAKYTYVAAENDAVNPWTTLREDHGFSPDDSTVTVFGAEGPHNVNDHGSVTAEGVVRMIAGTLGTPGHNHTHLGTGAALIIMGREHAAICARDGWSKEAVKDRIYDLSHIRGSIISPENRVRFARLRPEVYEDVTDDSVIPTLPSRDALELTVTGGAGKHSLVIPAFGVSECQTVRVKEART